MKWNSSLLLFTLTFYLNIFLINNTAQACSYPDQPDLQKQKDSCDQATGKNWSCTSNRCMTSAESVATQKEFNKCKDMPANQQNSCVKSLAQQKTGVQEGSRKTGGEGGGAASVVATAYSALLFFGVGSEGDVPSCTSKSIFMGSSLAFLAFHFYTLKNSKDKFKELLKEYESATNAYDKQVKAFMYLKKEQEIVAKIAAEHKKFYTLTALGYSSALAVAIAENIGKLGMSPCGAITGPLAMLSTSTGVAVASGVGLGITFTLREAAAKQEKESKANAQKIQTIIAGFTNSMKNYCPNGRDNPSQPDCYCMNKDGSQNTKNRSESNACQKYWSELDKGYFAKSNSNKTPGTQMGCVTITQKFDPKCQCKKLKDKKTGQNACFKVAKSNIGLGSISGISAFSPMVAMKGLEMAGSGKLPGATISGQSLRQLAFKSRKAATQLIKKYNKSAFGNGLPQINLELAKKKLLASSGVAKQMSAARNAILKSSTFEKSNELKKAMESLQKKGILKYSKSSKRKRRKSKKSAYALNFGSASSGNGSKVINYKEKNYDYKNNDISQRTDVNIFDIISKRYMVTGLKALFDE